MRRVAITVVAFLLAAGFYLLLVDTDTSPELYAGAGVALLAAVIFEVSRERRPAHRRAEKSAGQSAGRGVSLRWFVPEAARAVGRIPGQTALVSWEALAQLAGRRRARGRFHAVPYRASDRGFTHRAIAETLGSLAPNTIVIGIDTTRRLLLVHELRHPKGGGE